MAISHGRSAEHGVDGSPPEEVAHPVPHADAEHEQPLERANQPELTQLARALALLALAGCSVGLAIWTFAASRRLLPYVASNRISVHGRHQAIFAMLAGAVIAAVIGLAWQRAHRPTGMQALARLSQRASPFVLSAFVPLLFRWQLWVDRDLDFLVLSAMFVLTLRALLAAATDEPIKLPARLESALVRVSQVRGLPIGLVIASASAYAIYFSIHTLNTHYRIETSVYDLGIENNLVWNAIHWGPLFRSTPLGGTMTHLGYHQTYFAYVLGIPYRLAPRPETLLVIQAVMLGFAAVPLYFVAKRKLGPWVACLFGLLYLFYAPLHGSNLYDFHYQPLGVFFLWLTLALLWARRDGWAALSVLLLLSVREDMSALLAVIGAYLLLSGERPRAGLCLAIVGTCYFIGLKFMIMPRFLEGESAYVNQYARLLPEGDTGFSGVLKTALANPGYAIKELLERDKLIYVLQLLTPLAFVNLLRPIGLFLLIPGFFFTLLSTQHVPSISISFQYTAYWTPFVFIGAIVCLSRMAGHARRSWLLTLPVAMLITSYQHGAILQHNTARTHFIPYRFGITDADRKRHDDLYALIAQIPPMAKVSSSEWVVAQVSSRPDSYALRDSVYDAQYMLVSLDTRQDELQVIRAALRSGQFGVVEQRGQYALAERGYSTTRNPALLDQLR
jgi:uncharacterized membrane protein